MGAVDEDVEMAGDLLSDAIVRDVRSRHAGKGVPGCSMGITLPRPET